MSEVGKSAFGICHHNQSRKQSYCPGFTMMFDEPEQIFVLLRPLCFASSSIRFTRQFVSEGILIKSRQ